MSDSEQFRVPNLSHTRAKSAWLLPSQKSWNPLFLSMLAPYVFALRVQVVPSLWFLGPKVLK